MKKKLNCFCILLLVLMVASFVMSCVAGADDFNRGWQEGSNSQEPMAKSFNEYGYGSFISGPSKTADIAQVLVMGAQAARSATVLLLDE